MNAIDPILKARLFGYGTPYRVELADDGSLAPVPTDAAQEAEALSRQLRALVAGESSVAVGDDVGETWAYSMPFGRCGIEGLPREHIQVFFCREAFVDVLDKDGLQTRALAAGEIFCIEPRSIVRLRVRPQPTGRALVAFQTQDHTPLSGNAGPFSLGGDAPEDWRERLVVCHATFDAVVTMQEEERREHLSAFFAHMAANLAGNPDLDAIQHKARALGSYDVADEAPFFQRQRELLTDGVLRRIQHQDEAVFRFPGMFGGVAPLFNLIE